MKEKKSIISTKAEVLELSRKYPDVRFNIMDKKGERAMWIVDARIKKQLIRAGWSTMAAFRAGKEIQI